MLVLMRVATDFVAARPHGSASSAPGGARTAPLGHGPPRLSQSRQVRPIALSAAHLAGFSSEITLRSGTYRPQEALARAAPNFRMSMWAFTGRLTTRPLARRPHVGRASRLGGLARGRPPQQGQVT